MSEKFPTKGQVLASLADSIQVSYTIECDRCKRKFDHSFAFHNTPTKKDKLFVAEMAYDEGWLIAGGRYFSAGECNGEFVTFALCPECGNNRTLLPDPTKPPKE